MRACLGETASIQHDRAREIWWITRKVQPDVKQVVVPVGTSTFEAMEPPTEKLARFFEDPAHAAIAPGYCVLRVEIDEGGRVSDFTARGIDSAELNADERCARLALACVDSNE